MHSSPPDVTQGVRAPLLWSIPICVSIAACGAGDAPAAARAPGVRDAGASDSEPAPRWRTIFQDLPSALTNVWGENERDVWVVGSDAHDGLGPLVLHYAGGQWARQRAASDGDLFWVHGFANGPVFFGGSDGKVLRFADGRFERIEAPRSHGTVYGVWGADPSDVWAVGGDPLYGTGAFVWRYDGTRFVNVGDLPVAPSDVISYFKVWGTSRSDVWIVGTPGIAVHYDGSIYERVDVGVPDPLFTVHALGSAGSYAVVGGADLGVLLERRSADTWKPAVLPTATRLLTGIWLTETGGYAVGGEGTVLSRIEGRWERERTGITTTKALHSVWVDPTGDVWAVGGDVLSPPFGSGLLVHRGVDLPRDVSVENPPDDAGRDVNDAALDVRSDAKPGTPLHGESIGAETLPESGPIDAAPDHVTTDGGNVARPAGFVQCGTASCALATARCCADATTGAPAGCVDLPSSCPLGQAPVSCDEPSDCAPGQRCCLNRYLQAGALENVQCQPTCVGPSVCLKDADCGGATCSTFPIMKSYMICPRP